MKNLLLIFAILHTANAFATNCVNKEGKIAEISGLTLTIWNSEKSEVFKTVDAVTYTRTPKSTYYYGESDKVLFSKNKIGTLHQGGRVEVKSTNIKHGKSKFVCKN